MPSNTKANNQYYGKYRECCVVAQLNNTEIEYNEDYTFTEEEKEMLYKQSKLISDYIGNHTATYVGNHTATQAGDIVLDTGETVELKTISNSSSGTYGNHSVYYFTKFGFDFKQYMINFGLYDALEAHFGDKFTISRKNNSPVNAKVSSEIRHKYTDIYENEIVPIDKQMREQFTQDIVDYFIKNPDKVYEFISDMINKDSGTCSKGAPDRLIALDYVKNIVKEINIQDILQNTTTEIESRGLSFVFNTMRIAISWQNGIGLNNPTIRVFLEDK